MPLAFKMIFLKWVVLGPEYLIRYMICLHGRFVSKSFDAISHMCMVRQEKKFTLKVITQNDFCSCCCIEKAHKNREGKEA